MIRGAPIKAVSPDTLSSFHWHPGHRDVASPSKAPAQDLPLECKISECKDSWKIAPTSTGKVESLVPRP